VSLSKFPLPVYCSQACPPSRSPLIRLGYFAVAALVFASVASPPLMPRVQAQTVQAGESSATTAQVVLGVVRSGDNAANWQQIITRLEAIGIPYQVIDWERVGQNTRFDGISVLFLPDILHVSAEQVLALQSWVNRGGNVIASGRTGTNGSAGVRRAFQSLLGAYWESSLATPVTLQPVSLNSHRWLREGDTQSLILGGNLIPTGLGSQSVATWRTEGAVPVEQAQSGQAESGQAEGTTTNTVAIVTTRQTVFLGWQWGHPNNSVAEFDGQWLAAALNRFQNALPMSEVASPSAASAAPPTGQPAPAQTSPAQPLPAPPRTALPQAIAPTSPSPILPPSSRRLDAEVAPPGLVVEPGAMPISLVEAIAMRQELENLIGRYESALIAAEAAAGEFDIATGTGWHNSGWAENADGLNLTASIDEAIYLAANPDEAGNFNHQVLHEARQKLTAFLELVRQREYETARNEWLTARQLLWENLPTDRPLAQTEIRAIWLDRGTIVEAGSKQGLTRIFDQLAAAGINTVFFETVNAGYPIYPSQIAPQPNPLIQGWDPLAAAVDLAHERDMEIHAWVWTFAAGNEAHNRVVNEARRGSVSHGYPGPLLSANPDWASLDNRGNLNLPGHEEPFLDPANPAVRRYLLQLFEEIITRYNVDGLQLDYIRYPFQNPSAGRSHGYGTAARQEFRRLTGVDPITLSSRSQQNDLWQQWTAFRVNQISSFVAETSQLRDRLRPEVVLSTAVFALPTQERIQKIQQNWEVWAQRGDVDMVVLMAYAADTNRLQQLTLPWLTHERPNLGSTIILPGIRILNLPDAMVFDQIQALRDLPSGGYALFATAHLHENLQGILNRTQGMNQTEPIPFREPFAAAANRFTALRREWNWMSSQDQLWIREREQAEWSAQVEALNQALADLTANPSHQKYTEAQALLQTFQTQFDDWMYLQSLTQSYRVRTWKHRLTVIENLLAYGERRL
jgi:uncharacterized lipoprotein YddW (UPF0748 family)